MASKQYITIKTENTDSSFISGLADGGYNLIITDNTGNQWCYRAWVFADSIDANISILESDCETLKLKTENTHDVIYTYYDPPRIPFVIDDNTEIEVCFDAVHPYVRDLGFYVQGPPSCGSPLLELSKGSSTTGGCPPGKDVTDLCFTTFATNSFSGCNATTPFSGDFVPAQSWSLFYGCNAADPGWKVLVEDCGPMDIGNLTHAKISFKDLTACGFSSYIYDSGPITSPINDNTCNPTQASSFQIGEKPVEQYSIQNPTSVKWFAPSTIITNPTNDTITLAAPKTSRWFYVTTSNSFNCSIKDSIYYTAPTLKLSGNYSDDTCGTESAFAAVNIVKGTAPYSYFWKGLGSVTDSLFYLTKGKYTVKVTDAAKCTDSLTFNIKILEQPVADFMADPTETTLDNATVRFNDNSTGNPVKWLWNFGDSSISYRQNTFHDYIYSGSFPVKLIITTQLNCVDSITKEIIIRDPDLVFAPNAFTPNGDGRNDVFKVFISGIEPDSYYLEIYDRWGTNVFKSKDPKEEWSGSVNGKPSEGIFAYRITYRITGQAKQFIREGTLVIVK